MKKMICMAALLLCSVATLKAQTPSPPPVPFNGSEFNGNNGRTTQNTIKGAGPIAPATLLLLGLAGGFAGVKIYRNSKKEEE